MSIMLEKWEEFQNSDDFPVKPDDTFISIDSCEESFYAGWNMAEENQENIGAHDFMRDQEKENQELRSLLKEAIELAEFYGEKGNWDTCRGQYDHFTALNKVDHDSYTEKQGFFTVNVMVGGLRARKYLDNPKLKKYIGEDDE